MMKQFWSLAVAISLSATVKAQTLFSYGNEKVTVTEFLQAYNKNNTSSKTDEKSLREYLNLYIVSKLKIKEAKELRFDTLPQLVSDLENLRTQILPGYMADEESMQRLVKEAMLRQEKDIHLAHIFIAAPTSNDTADARVKALEAYKKLQSGTPFAAVAKAYSSDPAAATNGGDVGYVTVFNLPYELENLLYSTPVGKLSAIYRSSAGYHIFKNLGERKALGKIKAAQILLASPFDASEAVKSDAKRKADSIYNRLLKGDDFGKLAAALSNDVVSAASNGSMPEFGVGQYDPVFEKTIYALTKPGSIAPPFQTAHGWHIVKLISKVPLEKSPAAQTAFRAKIENSDRTKSTQDALAKKILNKAKLKQLPFKQDELWLLSDSAFLFKTGAKYSITPETALFRIGDQSFTAQDWLAFAQVNRYKKDASGLKSYQQVWEEFIPFSAIEYYKKNMEIFNPAFKAQIEEFRDGNLFFEIMQKKIWGPSQTDTVALLNYFNRHKNEYHWKASADAVIFYASDEAKGAAFKKELMAKPAAWKDIVKNYAENISADSNRFELSQIPGAGKEVKKGTITDFIVNKADNTVSFSYVINLHPAGDHRSFNEAKGAVITDYQNELEKAWIESLRKKYPVIINEQAFQSLLKKKAA